MHGNTEKSMVQRLVLTTIHLLALLTSAWILFASGQETVFNIFGDSEISSSLLSRVVIFSLGLIYFVRLCFTTFTLLKRQMPWNEMIEVGMLVAFIQVFFAILLIYNKEIFTGFDWIWLGVFAFGSYLNTASEWQRMIWKKDKSNKGKLYTRGLFKYSMHVNYLGDTILFTAFAMLTGSLWALSIPVVMTIGFIFMHIPKLDIYLKERYKEQYDAYASRTKKFIPWIY